VAVPPVELLADCKERPVKLETNGDIIIAYQSVRGDLKRCNADKAALRAWAKEIQAK